MDRVKVDLGAGGAYFGTVKHYGSTGAAVASDIDGMVRWVPYDRPTDSAPSMTIIGALPGGDT